MKKLVFAAQVFGLLAMFPIVVFLEMNHETGRSENVNPSEVMKISEKPFGGFSEKSPDKRIDEIFNLTTRTFF